MTAGRFIVGDSLTVLRTLPAASVDLVITSPPFLALRSYLPDDHPDKDREMGSEDSPGEFLDALLDVIVECRRVLATHGSLCVELGDTYAGSGGAGGDYQEGGLREEQPQFGGSARANRGGRMAMSANQRGESTEGGHHMGGGWPEAKSLCLIPESFRWALAYGRNPFTGRELEPWRARNVVRWCRPNPPVGALADKFRPATSDIVIACTSRSRFFDLDAVRVEPSPNTHPRAARVGDERRPNKTPKANSGGNNNKHTLDISNEVHPAGAPPLDHWWFDDTFDQDAWLVSVRGYPGQHYATYPPQLIDRLVKAMCPPRVCTTCGEPSRRITETTNAVGEGFRRNRQPGNERNGNKSTDMPDVTERITVGWTDCGHNTWRRGVILDPFAGSGTTLAVATGHGHDAIGIDLDERNSDLALERVGMFLTVERFTEVPI